MLLNRPKAHQLMLDAELDALVIAYTENVMIFSDFLHVNSNRLKSRLYFLIFFADERFDPVFLVPHQDADDARRHSWIRDIRPTSEFPYPGRSDVIVNKEISIADALQERGLATGNIGFENATLPFDVTQRLKRALPDANFKPASALLAHLRAVKSPEELRRIRGAMSATQAGARAILQHADAGVSEKELAAVAKQACLDAGAEHVDFLIIGAAENGAIVHGTPSDYQLKEGDIVRFDLGAVYDSYPGDFARTFVVGERVLERDRRHYQAVHDAVCAGVEMVAPGITAGEVYAATMRAGQAIDPGLQREHVGHGMGLEVHEEPMIYQNSPFVLEPGMIMMVECGRYVLGQAGYQLEDLVLVTEAGYELMTDVPRDLLITR